MDALVTGATGSLGSTLVRGLRAEGADVRALVLPGESDDWLRSAGVQICHGDLREPASLPAAVAGVRVAFHVAGIAAPLNAFERQMWEVNVEGTRNLLEAASCAGVERVVHTSSVSAIGWPDQADPVDETFPFNGECFDHAYMRTKRAAEDVALGFANRDLDVVVVNPSAVMAPGGSPRYGWSALVRAVRRGAVIGSPQGGLSMTGAADFVDAMLRAAKSGRRGERYIVAAHLLSFWELLRLIADVVGGRAPRLLLPDKVVAVACRAGTALSAVTRTRLILARENLPLLTRRMYYSQAKAERALGVQRTPLEIAIDDVARTIRGRA